MERSSAPPSKIELTLNDVLDFIDRASRDDRRGIVLALRAAQRRDLEEWRERFKPGDEVEWEIKKNSWLSEYFRGTILKLNLTTCSVSVRTGREPLRFQGWRVPFELLRHVTESTASLDDAEDQGT